MPKEFLTSCLSDLANIVIFCGHLPSLQFRWTSEGEGAIVSDELYVCVSNALVTLRALQETLSRSGLPR